MTMLTVEARFEDEIERTVRLACKMIGALTNGHEISTTKYSKSESAPSSHGVYVVFNGHEYEITIQKKK